MVPFLLLNIGGESMKKIIKLKNIIYYIFIGIGILSLFSQPNISNKYNLAIRLDPFYSTSTEYTKKNHEDYFLVESNTNKIEKIITSSAKIIDDEYFKQIITNENDGEIITLKKHYSVIKQKNEELNANVDQSIKKTYAVAIVVRKNEEDLISIKGDNLYAIKTNKGLKLDFTNTSVGGKGFSPNAVSEFHKILTITNQSEKNVYVWLEADGWTTQHNSLTYKVANSDGRMTPSLPYGATGTYENRLLWTSGTNFNKGVGHLAYVRLEPGQYFDVDISANTTNMTEQINNLTSRDWSHTVIVRANTKAPSRPPA